MNTSATEARHYQEDHRSVLSSWSVSEASIQE